MRKNYRKDGTENTHKNFQKENSRDSSEDQFDWDWIFDREWLRIKK